MYFAYIMRCADGTLYTGYTDDIARREAVHNSGRGAKYTRSRLPVKMVYHESFATRSEAMKRECAIKRLSREQKLKLIAEHTNSRAGMTCPTCCCAYYLM